MTFNPELSRQLERLRELEGALDNLLDVIDANTPPESLASYGAVRATHGAAVVALGQVQKEMRERESLGFSAPEDSAGPDLPVRSLFACTTEDIQG